MIRYYKFLVPLLLVFTTFDRDLFGQEKSDLEPEIIINNFIEKTGGEKWRSLKSRKEYTYVEYAEDKNAVVPTKSHDRIKAYLHGGLSIEVHKISEELRSILVYKPECNWYYSTRSQVVKFFGPEPLKFKITFPRTELMEILNLEPLKKVSMEDTLYRVDFKDIRQLEGKHSLFFGANSGLLYKRAYTSKNEVRWAYHFSNYTVLQGFSEPHLVTLTSNDKEFFRIIVKSIEYNVEIGSNIFNPPIPCMNEDDFRHLEFPYTLEFN